MKKYEQLENQIAELKKEVERLKNEEKKEEEKDKLPLNFGRKDVIGFLNGKHNRLQTAFTWNSTPQGHEHWKYIYMGMNPLTNEDIIQLQKWVILSYQQEENK
jgi:hypothetical protein